MEEFCFRLLTLMLTTHQFVSSIETPASTDRSASAADSKCPPVPRPCECERMPSRLVFNCRQQELDRIPTFNHSDQLVDELTLADNRIVTLPNNAFRGLRVRRLDLKDNRLYSVSSAAFAGLERFLEELRIQLDPAAVFPSEAVKSLTSLRVLDVIGYGGASLPRGALATFGLVRELRLTSGSLRTLSPADLTAMRTSLSVVDLSGSPLSQVPTAALATLSNLTEVSLSGCHIARLGARAFATNWTKLRRIDLSQNQLETVDEDAFRGVGGQSVHDLSIRSSHLSNEHLPALLSLTKLRRLDIALNKKITTIDRLLDALPALQTLDASYDSVSSLGQAGYISSSSLRVLNVADNQLINVVADAFLGLTALEELRLDGARLTLDNDSFVTQRDTLRTLSLRRCNFTQPPWSSIAGLGALQILYISHSSLNAIPEFTFMNVGQLQTLDLSYNSLRQLTQRSLAGLHANLEIIKLDSNRLTTLDRCVFYRFGSIDLLKLGLANNPLQCDCDLQWLYKRLQPYNETFWFTALQWHCANVNKMFNRLNDADFASCATGTVSTMSECEDLIPTTTPAVVYPTDPRLELKVISRTQSSVTVEWTVTEEVEAISQVVITSQWLERSVKVRLQLAATQSRHVLTGLHPNTTYKVCVELTVGNQTTDADPIVTCCPTTTSFGGGSTLPASMEVILAVLVGGGLAAVIIVLVAVYCCCAARRRRRRPVSSTAPKQSVQTKRFRKLGTVATSPTGGERTSNPYNSDVDRAIAETVERLDPSSKEVLANLLRSASAYSLDNIGGTSYYPSSPPGTGAQDRPTSTGQHFYEELPDDTIPTDDFV